MVACYPRGMPDDRTAPWNRAAFLKTVSAEDREIASRLCDLLEGVFPRKDIVLYSGFPVVIRDMEWIAGFAMRKKCPMVYCCSPAVLEKMAAELAPFMAGKSCMELRARPRAGLTLDDAWAVAEKAIRLSSKHAGMISKADRKKRAKLRATRERPK